ncbi:MAG TPA: beta-ketoacyl-[acyl-carrier-protein] synthase family protein [Thermoanaerobaculia bacterium]|jgi:nodulation protein E|nr:beta-ketoacyl-[acyl-carrier-protein] synthase family protein [Thermoanaerobaculia bacterium]
MRRVVVTGLGAVSALGLTAGELWRALAEGRSGIQPIEGFDVSQLRFKNGAQVRGFAADQFFDRKACELLDRFAQLLVVATREAVRASGLVLDDELRSRTAVVTGSSLGGQLTEERAYTDLYRDQRPRIEPLTIPRAMANAGASHISMELGISGPSFTLSTACSSSAHAVGLAFWMVRLGLVDAAIAGGSETPFTWANLKAWEALRVVAPEVCRPFSKDRQGMVLGEGGAALVLETLERAESRGAPILAEITGCGMSSDAHHITLPLSEGAAKAIAGCLVDAGLQPEEVDYINAHGTGTLANDPMEARAIRKVFGTHADQLPVSSTKSMHGHTLGAAGALECVATVLALRNGLLPPTIGFTVPDPECDLDVVPNEARRAEIRTALSNSFAFGGLNVVLAFRRWEESRT